MKEVREFSFWTLLRASWRGHDVIFGVTKSKSAKAMLQLTNEINKDVKIILMPEDSNAQIEPPSKEEFECMEKYFYEEGYFEFIEEIYNLLNNEPNKINETWFNSNLARVQAQAATAWSERTEAEYGNNET